MQPRFATFIRSRNAAILTALCGLAALPSPLRADPAPDPSITISPATSHSSTAAQATSDSTPPRAADAAPRTADANAPAASGNDPAPDSAPPDRPPARPPAVVVDADRYTGHPADASLGGRERKLPDHAGIFPHGPISLIHPPIKNFQEWLKENARIDLNARAAWVFQQASEGGGPDSDRTAASQDYRVFGRWHMWNHEEENKGWAGNLYARFEYRAEMFAPIAPSDLNSEIGTLHNTTYGNDHVDPSIVQLYYEQFLFDGAVRMRLGKVDPDDVMALGRFADDYRYFQNTLFSASPASNHPSPGLGFNAQWYVTPQWTLSTHISDVQAKKTTAGFDTIDDWKFFYGVDLTWSPTIKGLGRGNYRLGFEFRDAVPARNGPEDASIYFNVDQEIARDIAPFLRYGWGTGRSTSIGHAFSIGLGIDNPWDRKGDACGIGIGFNTDHDVDSDRDIEYAGELFYRFQLTHAMQFTLGGQLILEPITQPEDDVVGLLELRLVVDF